MKNYLIDSTNNNKVVGDFGTKKEAREYLKVKFKNSSINENWKEYQEDFFFVSQKEMNEAVRKNGIRMRRYYT